MARPKIPEELKKLHWRNYMATYRQRQKQNNINRDMKDNTISQPIKPIKPTKT